MPKYLAHVPKVDASTGARFDEAPSLQELKEFWSTFHKLVRSSRDLQAVLPMPASALEAVHGSHRSRPVLSWGLPLLGACFAVARIDFKSGQYNGSGFLVDASSLGLPHRGYVLVTCNHVVCDPDKPGATTRYKDSKHPARMKVTFELRDPDASYDCEVIWQSPLHELDISVLRLTPQPMHRPRYDFEAASLVLARHDPATEILGLNGKWRLPRLFPLHHPNGRHLEWSLEDNVYRGAKARPGTTSPVFLHYECPTETGSSGAPILNEDLEVVAIHRAGTETLHDGENPANPARGVNEGLSVQSLREAIKASGVVDRSHRRKKWLPW